MAASVIRFVLDGSGKVVAQAKQMESAFVRVAQGAGKAAANLTGGGGGSSLGTKGGRQNAGRFARIAQYASGFSPLGQIGSAVGSAPTAGIAAFGIAAVAAGIAVRQLGMVVAEQARVIESSIRTTKATGTTLAGAGASANQAALSSFMGRRDELIGGDRGTPEMRAQFAKIDSLQRQIDSVQTDRAMRVGENEMRGQLAQVKSPETAALLEITKKAQEEIDIQVQIRDNLNWFQKTFLMMSNGMQGRSRNADIIDAQTNLEAVAAGAP